MAQQISPEAKKMMFRATAISLIFILAFAAVIVSGFVFGLISERAAIIIGIPLMVINAAQLIPAMLRYGQIQKEYYAAQGGGNDASG